MIKEEELEMKTFRLEPSVWDLLEKHRCALGARSRTEVLRILIKGARVESVQIDAAILQPPAKGQVEADGDIIFA